MKIEVDTAKFDEILNVLEKDKSYLKVGVIGKTNSRSSTDGKTNAEIGLKHEFGKDGMPQRSFLRMPMNEKFFNNLEGSRFLKKKDAFAKEILEHRSLVSVLGEIGLIAEETIKSSFDDHGFGRWPQSKHGQKKSTLDIGRVATVKRLNFK